MRILYIIPNISFSFSSSRYLGYLSKKYDIILVTNFKYKRNLQLEKIKKNYVNCINLTVPFVYSKFPIFIGLGTLIEKIKPDIIHANNLSFFPTFQATKIGKKVGIPCVVHVHGIFYDPNKLLNFGNYLFLNSLGRRIFYNADLLICLTKSDAKELIRYGCPHEKIRIIPNGVDVEVFKPENKTIDNLLFWGGRFVGTKGLEYLINALNIVVGKKPYVKLIMTGDGPLLPKIYRMVQQFNLQKNVTFKGAVSWSTKNQLMSRASIILLPSLKEGMPYALLEAMACGKPVIASNIPGIYDVITNEKNGILVPPKDPPSLANAIIRLLDDESLRKKLGENARKLMVEKYRWDIIIDKIERVYNEVINKK